MVKFIYHQDVEHLIKKIDELIEERTDEIYKKHPDIILKDTYVLIRNGDFMSHDLIHDIILKELKNKKDKILELAIPIDVVMNYD